MWGIWHFERKISISRVFSVVAEGEMNELGGACLGLGFMHALRWKGGGARVVGPMRCTATFERIKQPLCHSCWDFSRAVERICGNHNPRLYFHTSAAPPRCPVDSILIPSGYYCIMAVSSDSAVFILFRGSTQLVTRGIMANFSS